MHPTERTFVWALVLGLVLVVFAGAGLLLYAEPRTPTAIVLACLWIAGAVMFLSGLLSLVARRFLNNQHWRILTGEEKDDE